MRRMSLFDDVAAERLVMADLLAGLTPDQLRTPSLCGKWTVQDVAGHLAVPFVTSAPRFVLGLVKARGSFHRANDAFARAAAARPIAELAEIQRAHATSHFAPPRHGPSAPLTDLQIHGQDIRRPLGLIRDFAPDRLRVSLDLMTSPRAAIGFVPKGRLTGLRFRATDLDWSWGDGLEIAGPAEALLLAMGGRRVALAELSGPGVVTLAGRA
jgi:uncharacterized protein (TIGR03083 family)